MKTLITGAAGFIGSSVTREVLADGQEVRAMVLPGEDQRNLEGLDVEVVEGDLLDPASLDRALAGCSRLYQLAAIYRYWHPKGPDFIRKVNIEGTRNILEAALKHSIEKVVYTSSVSSLGFHPDRPSTEDDFPTEAELKNQPYRESKYRSEMVAHEYKDRLPVVIVNPCGPIGVRDWLPTPTGRSVLDFLNGKMFAYVDAGVNLIDVEDLAKGFVLAEKKGRLGERYILGNVNITIKEFFDILADMTGIKAPSVRIPTPFLKVMGYIMETIADITKVEPLASIEHAYHVDHNEYGDPKKAREELGLPANDIRIAIHKACRYYMDTGAVGPDRLRVINLKDPAS